MGWIRASLAGLAGLFVEDGWLAAATVGWLVLAWLALPRLGLPDPWPPVLLFAGLAGILGFSVARFAAASRHRARLQQ